MSTVVVILDGASESPGLSPTSLELARTPALDELCARGSVSAFRTTPAGLEPGSEVGIASVLGHPPRAQPSRGLIEAAGAGLPVPAGMRAWRCDAYVDGMRHSPPDPGLVARSLEASASGCRAHHLRGHRFLLVGPRRPEPAVAGLDLHLWGDGARLPAARCDDAVMISGPGAAAGIARLLGARARIPPTATGARSTDLGAKREAALEEMAPGRRVIVHVASPDEAAHERDAEGKVAALEAIDAELIAPLADAVLGAGGSLRVLPDHGTDPGTGHHLRDPVPSVFAGAAARASGPERLSERLLAGDRLEEAA